MSQWRHDAASNRYYCYDAEGRIHYSDEVQQRPGPTHNPRNIPVNTSSATNALSGLQLYNATPGQNTGYTYDGNVQRVSYVDSAQIGNNLAQNFSAMSIEGGNQDPSRLTSYVPQPTQPSTWWQNGIQNTQVTNPRTEVTTLTQTGPPNIITPAELYADGIHAHMNLPGIGAESSERLFERFRRRSRSFFSVGRVLRVLWSEPAGDTATLVSAQEQATSLGRFNEPVFSKVRRFVVVRAADTYCCALQITTYGHRGVAKPGVKKSEHSIIYTTRSPPTPSPEERPQRGERPMQAASIRVVTDNRADRLDDLSRIDYGKVYTIQHNIKAESYGLVHESSMNALTQQFRDVWTDLGSAAAGNAAGTTVRNAARRAEPNLAYPQRTSSSNNSNVSAGVVQQSTRNLNSPSQVAQNPTSTTQPRRTVAQSQYQPPSQSQPLRSAQPPSQNQSQAGLFQAAVAELVAQNRPTQQATQIVENGIARLVQQNYSREQALRIFLDRLRNPPS